MRHVRWPIAFAVAGVIGGLLLTLFSGFYTVKPFVVDAEIVYFGFPFPWLEAGRSAWKSQIDWRYFLLWGGFIADFVIYGFLSLAGTYALFVAIVHRKQKE